MSAVKTDYRAARLGGADRAMLDFAVTLTRTPEAMTADHVAQLRDAGFDDAAIHDIIQVTAMFAYYNRIADGVGIDLEPDMPPPRAD